jgi:hypothetical protein
VGRCPRRFPERVLPPRSRRWWSRIT